MSLALPTLLVRPYAELLAEAAELALELPRQPSTDELAKALVEAHLRSGTDVRTEGVLEILPEGFGFVRLFARDLAPSALDAYVSPSQIRALNLRPGTPIVGPVRAPTNDERFLAMVRVDRVHGAAPDRSASAPPFESRTPIAPTRPLAQACDDAELSALAQLAPWCHGHRVLVTAPPHSDATDFVTRLAAGLSRANPELVVVASLVDRQAEQIAAARHRLAGTAARLAATAFATAADRHVTTARLAHAHARRILETGRDVLLVVDSLTALVRAAGRTGAPSGAWALPGLDAAALLLGQELFGSARQLAEGGSLTVVATAASGPDAALDGAVAKELSLAANSEVVLVPGERGAIVDLSRSRTRPEHDGRDADQRAQSRALRERLAGLAPPDQLRALTAR